MTNGAGSDPLLGKFLQYFGGLHPLTTENEIEELYRSIEDKKWLEAVLSTIAVEPAAVRRAEQPNIALFRYSTPASLYVAAFLINIRIQLDAPNIHRRFNGAGKGAFGSIVAQSWGTLYYNNLADLVNGSDFECNFLAVYANVNFIRGGQTYATYQGGGTPLAGIGGGSGQWTAV